MTNNNALFRVEAFLVTDKGRRPNNEDFITFFEPPDSKERKVSGCIYIVADGVGGASIGERASQYASEKVLYEYLQHPEVDPGKRLKQAINNVSQEIFSYAADNGIRMATTMTVAVVFENSLIAANVGDSRIYLIRGSDVQQITRDHNIVGELVRDGEMTEEEAIRSKAKNRLTRSVGGNADVHVDVFGPIPLQSNDKIVLCSDGLTRYAMRADIARLTSSSSSPEKIANGLVAFAKRRGHGGADNISVISVVYEPTESLESTIQRARPIEPEQPWEILETVTDFKVGKWEWVRQLPPWIIVAILILILAITCGITGYIYKNYFPQQFPSFGVIPTSISIEETISPSPISVLSSNNPIPTLIPTLLSDTLTPTLIFTSTIEPTISFTATNTLSPEPSSSLTIKLVNCLYTVKTDDNLSMIAETFGIGGNNYINITCSSNSPECAIDPRTHKILPGWILSIPKVNEDICTKNGGQPQ